MAFSAQNHTAALAILKALGLENVRTITKALLTIDFGRADVVRLEIERLPELGEAVEAMAMASQTKTSPNKNANHVA